MAQNRIGEPAKGAAGIAPPAPPTTYPTPDVDADADAADLAWLSPSATEAVIARPDGIGHLHAPTRRQLVSPNPRHSRSRKTSTGLPMRRRRRRK
jgi:hypothetical protein